MSNAKGLKENTNWFIAEWPTKWDKKFDSVLHVLAQQALTRAMVAARVGQAEKHPNLARAGAGAAQR